MKKIITAIEDPKLANEIKQEKEIYILGKDIQYKEGILEFLEKENNIDFIILKENIFGKIKIEELINQIKKINNKIQLIILSNNNKNRNKENIFYIYYSEKINKTEIIKFIKNKNIENKNENNNNKIKKIVNYQDTEKKEREESKKKQINQNNQIKKLHKLDKINNTMIITGKERIDKSKIAAALGYELSNLNNKILLVDLDFNNKNINSILNCKKYYETVNNNYYNKNINKNNEINDYFNFIYQKIYKNKINTNTEIKNNNKKIRNQKNIKNNNFIKVNNKIIKKLNKIKNKKRIEIKNLDKIFIEINNNFYLLTGLNSFIKKRNKEEKRVQEKIIYNVKKLEKYFDFIIIDYSISTNKLISLKKDVNLIYVLEPNIQGIKYLNDLLANNKKAIDNRNFKILINRSGKKRIDKKIIKKIFLKREIIGEVSIQNK